MRILAIRGYSLASLAGELELAAAPLGGAGAFVIVGNTTLLEAKDTAS